MILCKRAECHRKTVQDIVWSFLKADTYTHELICKIWSNKTHNVIYMCTHTRTCMHTHTHKDLERYGPQMMTMIRVEWLDSILVFSSSVLSKCSTMLMCYRAALTAPGHQHRVAARRWSITQLPACPDGLVFFSNTKDPEIRHFRENSLPPAPKGSTWDMCISENTQAFPLRRYSPQLEKEIKCFPQ